MSYLGYSLRDLIAQTKNQLCCWVLGGRGERKGLEDKEEDLELPRAGSWSTEAPQEIHSSYKALLPSAASWH